MMGEAEDIVLREMAQKKAAEEATKEQAIRKFAREVEDVVPRVLSCLREKGYPDTPPYERKLLKIKNEQRIGWKIHENGFDPLEDAYILSDGSFYVTRTWVGGDGPMDAAGLAAIFWYYVQQEQILRKLHEMAEDA